VKFLPVVAENTYSKYFNKIWLLSILC